MLANQAETGIRFEVGVSIYPRRGQRLAPETLRSVLAAPVPDSSVGAALMLCDLDETAWVRFDEQTCRKLARAVVRHLFSQQALLRTRMANSNVLSR